MALLIVDMIGEWRFPGADALLAGATKIAPAIADLREAWHQAEQPVVYVNDHFGDCHADMEGLVLKSYEGPGRFVTERLLPLPQDFRVLKSRHSGFYQTALDALLRQQAVHGVLVTGVAGDQCVLLTAADAKMRGFDVAVASDAIASRTSPQLACAVQLMRHSLAIEVAATDVLRKTWLRIP